MLRSADSGWLIVAAWNIVGRMVRQTLPRIRLPRGGHTYHQCFWLLIKLQTVGLIAESFVKNSSEF